MVRTDVLWARLTGDGFKSLRTRLSVLYAALFGAAMILVSLAVYGAISANAERTVRVRLAGENAWLTIKGRTEGITRAEFEYDIPLADARELLEICLPSVIDKTRHCVLYGAHVWEIDVFHGENEGLVVAEVELADESISPEIPPWIGREADLATWEAAAGSGCRGAASAQAPRRSSLARSRQIYTYPMAWGAFPCLGHDRTTSLRSARFGCSR